MFQTTNQPVNASQSVGKEVKHQHASVILNWETPKHQQKSAKQWGFSICTDGGNPMNIFHFGIFRITKPAVRKSMLKITSEPGLQKHIRGAQQRNPMKIFIRRDWGNHSKLRPRKTNLHRRLDLHLPGEKSITITYTMVNIVILNITIIV